MMKGKMLIASVATLSIAALLGCQQQPAAPVTTTTPTQPETKTSTATLEIMAPTQQEATANVEIMAPKTQAESQEGTMKTEAETKVDAATDMNK